MPAYYTADYILERAYARQLVSYPAVPDPTAYSAGWYADISPVADVATAVPTVANGGITNAGAYCAAEAKHFAHISSPTAKQVAAFRDSHSISGITTPN